MLVTDVDGTLTDGTVCIGEDGTQIMKVFHVKDGYAIHDLLPGHRVKTAIITGCGSKIVRYRAEMLNIDYLYQKITDKAEALRLLSSESGVPLGEMAYIGDDSGDKEAMELCALTGCPADAADELLNFCDFVSSKAGGKGAVREFAEFIVKKNREE